MVVIVTAHMFFCSTDRSVIAFSSDPKGANLPADTCPDWMHWKSTTIASELSGGTSNLQVTDDQILDGLMQQGYFITHENRVRTAVSLY